VSRTVAAGLEELAQAIAVPHLRDDRHSFTHPIHLVWLVLDLNHAMYHTCIKEEKKGELTLIEKIVMSIPSSISEGTSSVV
jgi:hypothetical protein